MFISFYRDTQMPSRIPFADARIKNWPRATAIYKNPLTGLIIYIIKLCTATLKKAGQFFMPTLMPCKWSLMRQFLQDDLAICKDALFITAISIIC
jgi:hypothetical protein